LNGTGRIKAWGREHSAVCGVDIERSVFCHEKHGAPYHLKGTIQEDYRAVREGWGVYAEDGIPLGGNWRAILGARYDEADYDFTNCLVRSRSTDTTMSEFSPRVGFVWAYREEAEDDSCVYANAAKAFRTPTLGQMFTYSSANARLDPEEAANYELGVRHRFGEAASGRLSAYWMNVDDEIWYDYATTRYQNHGETVHKGIESRLFFFQTGFLENLLLNERKRL